MVGRKTFELFTLRMNSKKFPNSSEELVVGVL